MRTVHKSPLFSADTLAELIERYPREHYSLVQTGARGSSRVWREGEIGDLGGRQVMDAISRGGLWLNMRDVGAVDRRYREMLDGMFEEIAAKVPGFRRANHQESILISSPDAQVYYHADLPGQAPDPDRRPQAGLCLSEHGAVSSRRSMLEDIAVFDVEVDIPYEPWYDKHARVFDIGPGQMLNWELNAPHRVENLDTFSVSMTVVLHQRSDPPFRDR